MRKTIALLILGFAFSASSLAFGCHNPDVGTIETTASVDFEKTFVAAPVVAYDFSINTICSENCELVLTEVISDFESALNPLVVNEFALCSLLDTLPQRIHRTNLKFMLKNTDFKTCTRYLDIPLKVGWHC